MKAVALVSGGLDSTLVIRVVLDQSIEVEAINYFTPFCRCSPKGSSGYEARAATERPGVKASGRKVEGFMTT